MSVLTEYGICVCVSNLRKPEKKVLSINNSSSFFLVNFFLSYDDRLTQKPFSPQNIVFLDRVGLRSEKDCIIKSMARLHVDIVRNYSAKLFKFFFYRRLLKWNLPSNTFTFQPCYYIFLIIIGFLNRLLFILFIIPNTHVRRSICLFCLEFWKYRVVGMSLNSKPEVVIACR